MTRRAGRRAALIGLSLAFAATAWLRNTVAQVGRAVAVDADDIAGVVSGPRGPEPGVWVIAETKDLPATFRKIVVTDESGRYLLPDLPAGSYMVWVRGYGLVDSPKVSAKRGTVVNLIAVPAPDARSAAQYYPASYWYSLVDVPGKGEFPGTGNTGNGISETMKSQADWINYMKSECEQCHQIGDKATREIPAALGKFATTADAWDRRVQSGQQGAQMSSSFTRFGRKRALAMFADWTDRIAAGEVPPAPPRPQGLERNVVISQWDGFANQYAYVHDLVATDRRNPTLNANGPVYNIDRYNNPDVNALDPVRNAVTLGVFPAPAGDPALGPQLPQEVTLPSPYWGDDIIWTNHENVHNPMMDGKGRIWMTSAFRPGNKNPAFCRTIPSARLFPLERSGRQAAVYDPATKKLTTIDTCFGTHHLFFGEDKDNTLWFSGGGNVVGWLNTRIWDETHDPAKAQGWIPFIVDTNGNGKRDAYVEPDQPIDPKKDKRFGGSGGGNEGGYNLGFYGVMPNPVDGTIWGAVVSVPGAIVRVNPGTNPPDTSLTEIYEPPFNNPNARVQGFTPRGIDIDRNGVVWTGLQSGHLASFDRRKCRVLNGPTAIGQHCPEGWTLHQIPGPQFKNVTEPGSADFMYYNWVDQFDTFGLGTNVPFAMGSASDSLMALMPESGKFVVLRVPYPRGFYAKGADGRIDDPKAGWKGKGLWATYSSVTPWHYEGGRGQTSKAVKFQLRPNPLAK
jgi:hypothetical protein